MELPWQQDSSAEVLEDEEANPQTPWPVMLETIGVSREPCSQVESFEAMMKQKRLEDECQSGAE